MDANEIKRAVRDQIKAFRDVKDQNKYVPYIVFWEEQQLRKVPGYNDILVHKDIVEKAKELLDALPRVEVGKPISHQMEIKVLFAKTAGRLVTENYQVRTQGYSQAAGRFSNLFPCPIEEFGMIIRLHYSDRNDLFEQALEIAEKLESKTGFEVARYDSTSLYADLVYGGYSGITTLPVAPKELFVDVNKIKPPLARIMLPFYNQASGKAQAYFGEFFFSLFPEYAPGSFTVEQVNNLRSKGASFWAELTQALAQVNVASSSTKPPPNTRGR